MCRKEKAPRKWPERERLRGIREHLYYERDMLIYSLARIGDMGPHTSAAKNCFIESFTIHARSLYGMLYAENPRDDDVIAEDFFSDREYWKKIRPDATGNLKKIHGRVGKEVAHLTYGRIGITEEEKNWPYTDIANDLLNIFKLFESNADLLERK